LSTIIPAKSSKIEIVNAFEQRAHEVKFISKEALPLGLLFRQLKQTKGTSFNAQQHQQLINDAQYRNPGKISENLGKIPENPEKVALDFA